MLPPTCTTRSKVSPGLIDCPGSHRASTVVVQEKTKKQQAATLKAEKLRRRAEQVSEVEREVRVAQAEGQSVGRGGIGKVAKKTFWRPGGDVNFVGSHRKFTDCKFTDFPTVPRAS